MDMKDEKQEGDQARETAKCCRDSSYSYAVRSILTGESGIREGEEVIEESHSQVYHWQGSGVT